MAQFLGRERDLLELHGLLRGKVALTTVAIVGMAGVGKTELAFQYGKAHQADYGGGVLRFEAQRFGIELVHELQTQLKVPDFDRFSKLEDQVACAWKEFREVCGGGSALIIIDDVTDYRQQVKPYLPPTDEESPFQFLLTSRTEWGGIPSLSLSQLGLGAAVDLLGHWAERQWSGEEKARAAGLCERLGCLPLAIVLVGSWIGWEPQPERDLALAIDSLERRGLESPALEPNPLTVDRVAERGMNAALQLSWDQLGRWNPEAQMLARVLTLFAPGALAWEWVEGTIRAYEQWLAEATVAARPERVGCLGRLLGWRRKNHSVEVELSPVFWGIQEPVEARAALVRLSLWQRVEPGWFRLHPLLREFFANQWQGHDYQGWSIAYCCTISDLADRVPPDIDWERAAEFYPLRPQFEVALEQLEKLAANCGDRDLAKFYKAKAQTINVAQFRLAAPVLFELTFVRGQKTYKKAKACRDSGQATKLYKDALADYQQAVELARQAFPGDSLQLAGYLHDLAKLFEDLGRYREGIPPMEEAVEIAKAKATPKTVAVYLDKLAQLYKYQGYYKEAEPLHCRALELRKYLFGEEHPHVANSLNNLASVYIAQGRYEEAVSLNCQTLELRKRLFGEKHLHVALSLNNLAAAYSFLARYEEAEPLHRQALALRRELLGEENLDVALSLNNLALTYKSLGRYKKAEPLFHQSLALRKKLLGEKHPDVATSLHCLALLYQAQGRYDKAEPLHLQALQLSKQLLGEKHPEVANDLNNLADLYKSQGRYEEAESLYLQSLEISRIRLGQEHPDTQKRINNFNQFLHQAITNQQTHRLSDHPKTQALLEQLRNED